MNFLVMLAGLASHVCLCAARNPSIIAPQTCLLDASNFHVISRRAFWIFSRSFLLLLRLPSVGCSLCVVLVPNESFKSAFALPHLHPPSFPLQLVSLSYMNKRFSLTPQSPKPASAYFSVSHQCMVLALVPIANSRSESSTICLSSSPQVLFANLLVS